MTPSMMLKILVGLGVCGWVMEGFCYVRLSNIDNGEWERLGSPTFFLRHVSILRSIIFFYGARFRRLDDTLLSFFAWAMVAANSSMYGIAGWLVFLHFEHAHCCGIP